MQQVSENPIHPTVFGVGGAAYIIAGALAAFASRRQLAAVPREHRTPEMHRAGRDINLGIGFLVTGVVVALVGAVLFPDAARLRFVGGLGCFGALALGWLWSGRQKADDALAPFRDEAPWGPRPARRRYAKEHGDKHPD